MYLYIMYTHYIHILYRIVLRTYLCIYVRQIVFIHLSVIRHFTVSHSR